MKKVFIDTNIFLRFLTKDDNSKYERCKEIFKKAVEGEIVLATSAMVIVELVWTLLSYYKVPKADVVEKVSIIVGTESLHIPEKDMVMDALVLLFLGFSDKQVLHLHPITGTPVDVPEPKKSIFIHPRHCPES